MQHGALERNGKWYALLRVSEDPGNVLVETREERNLLLAKKSFCLAVAATVQHWYLMCHTLRPDILENLRKAAFDGAPNKAGGHVTLHLAGTHYTAGTHVLRDNCEIRYSGAGVEVVLPASDVASAAEDYLGRDPRLLCQDINVQQMRQLKTHWRKMLARVELLTQKAA